MTFFRMLLIFWAAMFVLLGQARADTRAEMAVRYFCGPNHGELAAHVAKAARRYMVRPVVLAAVMSVESGCRMDVVGDAGEVCAFQLRGVARNGHSKQALRTDPELCVMTGARWLSLRMRDCGGLMLGLSGYNAKFCSGGKRYARKVLAKVAEFWAWIRNQQRRES